MAATPTSPLEAWRDLVDSPERRELAESVRDHLRSRVPRSVVRAGFGGEPADVWDEIAGHEYPLIGLPEEAGGLGTLVDAVALTEATGRELLPAPLMSTMAANVTVVAAGLGPLADPVEPAALVVVPESTPGDGEFDGLVVLDGARARRIVVVQSRRSSTALSVVDVTDMVAPVAVHRHVDPNRPVAVFDLGTLTPHAIVDIDVDTVLAPARCLVAADLTGIAAGSLDIAAEHARTREQFGKPVGAFQGVKHRLADQYVALERARSLTRAAAVTVAGVEGESARELALLAKAAAADAAVNGTRALVQVLAAMGMTFESDAHLYFRRAQQTAPFLGSASACYIRAAELHRSGDAP